MKTPLYREEILTLPGTDFKTLRDIHFQILPHGDLLIGLLKNNSKEILFIGKQTEKDEWKSLSWRFSLENCKNLNENLTLDKIAAIIDNVGNFLLLFSTKNDLQEYHLFQTSSHDYGKTWLEPKQISPDFESWTITGQLVMFEIGFQTGFITVPLYNNLVNRNLSIYSENNGKTWNISLFVEPEKIREDNDEDFLSQIGTKEGKLIENIDGSLFLFCQLTNSNSLFLAQSLDRGNTWQGVFELDEFPGDLEGKIDVISLFDLNQKEESIILFGNQKIDDNYHLILWLYNSDDYTFQEIWRSEEKFSTPVKILKISKESNTQFHILYQTSDQSLIHQEFEI